MKVKLLSITLLLMMLVGCSSGPSTSDIRDDIPEEISQQYRGYDSTTPMTLDDVKIIQSKTEDKQKTIDCAFTFKDEYAECNAYWTLFYYQYDDGSWQLENWEKTKETESRPLQGPSEADIEEVSAYVSSCIYNPTYLGIDVDIQSDEPSAIMSFDVNNSFGYMSEDGVLEVKWTFFQETASWEYSFDDSNLRRIWNIENVGILDADFGEIIDNYALGFTTELFVDNDFFRELNGTDNIKYDVGNIFAFNCNANKIIDVIPSVEYNVLKKEMTSETDTKIFEEFTNDQCIATWSYPQNLSQDGLWEWHGTLWHRIFICDNAIYYSYVGLDDDGKHYWNGSVKLIASI